jgi:hypothetical protein
MNKPDRIKIVSGHPGWVEEQLNLLYDDYSIVSQNFAVVGDTIIITCLMVHQSEIRKGALAAATIPGRRQ